MLKFVEYIIKLIHYKIITIKPERHCCVLFIIYKLVYQLFYTLIFKIKVYWAVRVELKV